MVETLEGGGAGGGREGAGASKEQGEACERTGSAAKEKLECGDDTCVRYNEAIVGTVVFISKEIRTFAKIVVE